MVDNGFERSLGGIAPRVPAASQRRCDVTRALGLSNTEMRKDGEVTPTPTMGSYYDIDAILTDAQKVPCTFELEVPGLGYIDDNAGADIKPGTHLSLPLWLGELLAVQRLGASPILNLDLPPSIAPRVLNALKADPRTVELRALASHFYELAARVLELFEEEEIVDVLSETFKKRAAEIADHAHNPRGALGEGADFLRGLEEMERQLFRAAHDSSKAMRIWMGEMKKKS